MDYSLLSKFRGAWLGSIIAARMKGKVIATRQEDDLSSGLKTQQTPTYLADEKLLDLVQQQWRSLAIHWDLDSDTETLEQNLSQPKSTLDYIALRSLPIILYYHDYWSYLANFLLEQAKKENLSQSNIDSLLIWAFTIRLGLRGTIENKDLTQQILQTTHFPNSSSPRWLSEIEKLCHRGENSQKLIKNHSLQSELTVILSIFNFMNNTHDISLSTQQEIGLDNTQQIAIAALGGALSGAYNGLSSIPSHWRNFCQKEDYYQYVISKTEDIMGRWSGSEFTKETKLSPNIVTSVGILQFRKNLKIISQ